MIRKYQDWIKESEKVEASPDASITPNVTTDLTNPAAATPEPMTPMPTTPEEETTGVSTPDGSAESEIEQYKKLDTARKDAIKAFKVKQQEFLEIPEEVRKNPTDDADRTKVETLKTELIELNTTMKTAIKEWDKFNSETLGISDEEDEEDENYEP
jgi:hypothetical protein